MNDGKTVFAQRTFRESLRDIETCLRTGHPNPGETDRRGGKRGRGEKRYPIKENVFPISAKKMRLPLYENRIYKPIQPLQIIDPRNKNCFILRHNITSL
jgi:hypothetical protein